jgi:S-formylglutathione hydrolase FrmB
MFGAWRTAAGGQGRPKEWREGPLPPSQAHRGETIVKHAGRIAVLLLALVPGPTVRANPLWPRNWLPNVNRRLHGRVLDFTRNHGADRRIWSPALGERRDVYVYLPPGFDPNRRYPLIVWLHGFAQDETSLLRDIIDPLDEAMAGGIVPPAIIVAPDGSLRGVDCLFSAGSFFINSKAGRYEDYLMEDVLGFVTRNFPIRAEPGAHAIVGVSMGGGAAVHKVIKYSDYFKTCVGIFPAVNLRWVDCHGRYFGNFDPDCWGWRTDISRRREVLGRFYGVITIRVKHVITPLLDVNDPAALEAIRANNPIEMLDLYDVQPGQFALYLAYGGKDQFNLDAQVESFLFVAHRRGLEVTVNYDPNGKHDRRTAEKMIPDILRWLGVQLAPYGPTDP